MAENVWPQYGVLRDQNSLRLAEFIFNLGTLRAVLIIAGSTTLYLFGIFTPLPTIQMANNVSTNSWWFLDLIDELFTGGALGRGSIFCLGLFATFCLGKEAPADGQRKPQGWMRRALLYCALAALVTISFAIRGAIMPNIKALGLTFLCISLGGVAVTFINKWLANYRGPQIVHINILLLLYLHLNSVVHDLALSGRYSDLYLVAAGMIFIAVSAYYMFRTRIYLEVENIKSYTDRRFATLELRGVDESFLDLLGLTSVTLFLCCAGILSLVAGWRTISSNNFLVITLISLSTLLLVWAILTLTNRMLSSHNPIFGYAQQALDIKETLVFYNPFRYAHQLLNNFWIIPGVAAGQETETFIQDKLRRVLNKSFLLFVLWFVVILGLQLYAIQYRSGVLLFPYGPLVFIFLFLMCVGNVSMIWRHLRTKLGHFKQMARGKDRVMLQTYPLRSPNEMRLLDLGEGAAEYWEEERLKDQMREIIDWCRLLNQVQVKIRRPQTPRKTRIIAKISRLLIALLSGVVIAFLGGMLFVFMVPKSESKDLWTLIISLFLPGVFTPNVLWNLIKKIKG